MATINLGAIKFNWKGAYNNGTTYAVDDVVSSGGNSYVCIQAHSNQAVGDATAYWNIMSAKGTNGTNGTNGTDLTTTLTTQGDILYRDGSGLQRLAKGTAGQVLQMNSGATAPEYADASGGKTLGVTSIYNANRTSISNSANFNYWTFTYNQIKASSKLKIDINLQGYNGGGGAMNWRFTYDGTHYDNHIPYMYVPTYAVSNHGSFYIPGASSTGSKTIALNCYSENGNSDRAWGILNPNGSEDGRFSQTRSYCIITEYDF